MRKWVSVIVVLVLAIALVAGVFAHGVASAKSPKAQDQVSNFTKAAAGLKSVKAAGYWVPEKRNNVTSQLNSIPLGTKISISKLRLTVTDQTEDTAVVTATYKLKLKYKDKTQESIEEDTFTLKKVDDIWLISASTMWNNSPWSGEWISGMTVGSPTAASPRSVLYLALGVHVEPFGAKPSTIVGGGGTFSGRAVRPQDYHNKKFFAQHVTDINNLSAVMEKHGGKLTVQAQSPFTNMLIQEKESLLTDLEKKGHEVALHFHEDKHLGPDCEQLPVNTWTAVMKEEINYIRQAGAVKIRAWSGGNLYGGVLDAASQAGLDVYSDWKNPLTQTADTVTFGLQPWRPAKGPDPDDMSGFALNNPDGKIVFLPWGLSSTGGIYVKGRGNEGALFDTLEQSITLSLSKLAPGKVNVFHFVVHPGEITGLGGTPYGSLDKWLGEFVDPLVAASRVRWATYSEMADAYKAWEQE